MAYVQAACLRGERLKAIAVDLVRLLNSPSTRKETDPTSSMKPKSLAFLALLALSAPARSEEQATVTTARVLGDIPDGTPAPVTPVPEFIIPAKDILETTTHELDGRTITIQRIKPIDLPEPSETTPAPVNTAPLPQNLAATTQRPKQTTISLSATVYRAASHPPRSLVTYRPNGNGTPITFWSSADFSLLKGITSFLATDGQAHMLFLMCGSENTDTSAAIRQAHGIPYQPPAIPAFPTGNATYQIVGNPPAAEALIPIQSLHDLYNREFTRLLTAYQGREQARIQHEADLLANPPQPQDITLNYWRTEKPAPATQEGGAAQ